MAGRASPDTCDTPGRARSVHEDARMLRPSSPTGSQLNEKDSSVQTLTATNHSIFTEDDRNSGLSWRSVITADDSDLAEGYASSLGTGYMTSIASNVRRGVLENGRIYPGYGRHLAAIPMDDTESQDLLHERSVLLLDGQLHLAPIGSYPQKVLDLGTGTGLWAIDMADKYPSAIVQGVDIAPIAPNWVPPNCTFEVEDVEEDWTDSWQRDSYDLIHARELILAIRDWDKLIGQSYTRLAPGGWLELGGSVLDVSSDDGTIPEDSQYVRAGEIVGEIGNQLGTPPNAPYTWKQRLHDRGFANVTEIILKVPLGPWPKDKRLKQVGALNLIHSLQGIEAILLRGFTRILGGSYEECQVFMAHARAEMVNPKMHSYYYYIATYGQKPDSPTPWS